MSSIFTAFPNQKVKGFAGKEYSVPVYLQFVPGMAVEVVHSEESLKYGGPNTINTIIAKPHVTDKLYKRKSGLGERDRYYPLLRNHGDIPSKGDPVLLCTIGKINYYLGPINTISNNPTWNNDPSYVEELKIEDSNNTIELSESAKRGESQNFNKELLYSRLTKKRKDDLDYGNVVFETTGDSVFEGRHGNSLRLGSRSNNPYIFISNKRNPNSVVESILDGSIFSMTSNGTITRHLGNTENTIFKLSSDTVEDNTYRIGDIYQDLNGVEDSEAIYDYNGNQMLLHSDKITLNSKLDDIFVSSIKDIHIGAGRHISIGSFDTLNLLSNNVNIGNPNKATMENMVLGNQLQDVLVEIVNLLGRLQITTSLGLQTPLTVGAIPGSVIPGDPIATVITNLETKIQNIISTKHKIEQG